MTRPNKRAATLGYTYRRRQLDVELRRITKGGRRKPPRIRRHPGTVTLHIQVDPRPIQRALAQVRFAFLEVARRLRYPLTRHDLTRAN